MYHTLAELSADITDELGIGEGNGMGNPLEHEADGDYSLQRERNRS